MKVFIIAEEPRENGDVLFRIAAENVAGISPVHTIPGRGSPHGNPYILYGKDVERFTGRSKYDTLIVVSIVSSGTLD